MKRIIVLLALLLVYLTYAQEIKQVPQISVSGEGKVKVVPDQAKVSVSVESRGNVVKDVKKENDTKIDAILKIIKKNNIAATDYRTQRVSLNPFYDYEKKKSSYNASQTIEILIRDLNKYDELMEALVSQGINRIDNVVFQSSKMAEYESEARKLAMKDAKNKAEDYVFVLGQKVGKAISIADNSQSYTPQPMYTRYKTMAMESDSAPRETLAVGEISITANVSVTFILE